VGRSNIIDLLLPTSLACHTINGCPVPRPFWTLAPWTLTQDVQTAKWRVCALLTNGRDTPCPVSTISHTISWNQRRAQLHCQCKTAWGAHRPFESENPLLKEWFPRHGDTGAPPSGSRILPCESVIANSFNKLKCIVICTHTGRTSVSLIPTAMGDYAGAYVSSSTIVVS
jgi:hypothetical protein